MRPRSCRPCPSRHGARGPSKRWGGPRPQRVRSAKAKPIFRCRTVPRRSTSGPTGRSCWTARTGAREDLRPSRSSTFATRSRRRCTRRRQIASTSPRSRKPVLADWRWNGSSRSRGCSGRGRVPSGAFDWNVLFDPKGRTGEDRIDYQVIKANVDPWACCAGSPAGSTRWRLGADGSGFDHLFLAGAWIDSGFNIECIEAAVMSGRQAARAIVGTGDAIDGESFPAFRAQSRRLGFGRWRLGPKLQRNAFWGWRWAAGSLFRASSSGRRR